MHAVAVSDETGRAVVASELELHQVICNCADCCRGIVRAPDTGWSQQVIIKYIFDKLFFKCIFFANLYFLKKKIQKIIDPM